MCEAHGEEYDSWCKYSKEPPHLEHLCEECSQNPYIRKEEQNEVNVFTVEQKEAEEEMLNSMTSWREEDKGWTCIKTVVDSGAADSVAPHGYGSRS